MQDTVLLFESRDLCYESNQYFMGCLEEAFEKAGYTVEICDLSIQMEEKLERILDQQQKYLAAFDFNSLLPRLELEDGTPYLLAFHVPFFNYLVDHPLYHHVGLKKSFPGYSILCIDTCHQSYIKNYYPHIKGVYYLPLGGMRADMERSFGRKRLELLFLGTYEPEEMLYQEILDYPQKQRDEVSALIERMQADPELTQEEAFAQYLEEQNEPISREDFTRRMNQNYLADKYLRNLRRKEAVLAAAEAEVPFTVMGHGWETVKGLERKHILLRHGVGFAASLQIMADAKMLLNTTPGFHGGMHDRVYSAMMNHTLCFTEGSRFAKQKFEDGKEAVFYDSGHMDLLADKIVFAYENPEVVKEVTERAFQRVIAEDTWENRVEEILRVVVGE